jgi:uncharacterized SAM-binding protein YcdF (DUF218 family)
MFLLSKLLALFTQPLGWVAGLLLLALVSSRRQPKRAQRLVTAALVLLMLIGWLPLPNYLLQHLEAQYAEMAPNTDVSGYTGAIVLGGATENGYIAQTHTQPLLNDGAERMTTAVALLKRYPKMHVVYTGGEGELLGIGLSEAERARVFFDSQGATSQNLQYEDRSRNTYENAVLTSQLSGIDITKKWLLVTSAWHMPRSMGTFVKAGWNVTAYPVDFRTAPNTPWTEYSLSQGAGHWQIALHELVGLLAYRITGRL